jgi:hypothetical protein
MDNNSKLRSSKKSKQSVSPSLNKCNLLITQHLQRKVERITLIATHLKIQLRKLFNF